MNRNLKDFDCLAFPYVGDSQYYDPSAVKDNYVEESTDSFITILNENIKKLSRFEESVNTLKTLESDADKSYIAGNYQNAVFKYNMMNNLVKSYMETTEVLTESEKVEMGQFETRAVSCIENIKNNKPMNVYEFVHPLGGCTDFNYLYTESVKDSLFKSIKEGIKKVISSAPGKKYTGEANSINGLIDKIKSDDVTPQSAYTKIDILEKKCNSDPEFKKQFSSLISKARNYADMQSENHNALKTYNALHKDSPLKDTNKIIIKEDSAQVVGQMLPIGCGMANPGKLPEVKDRTFKTIDLMDDDAAIDCGEDDKPENVLTAIESAMSPHTDFDLYMEDNLHRSVDEIISSIDMDVTKAVKKTQMLKADVEVLDSKLKLVKRSPLVFKWRIESLTKKLKKKKAEYEAAYKALSKEDKEIFNSMDSEVSSKMKDVYKSTLDELEGDITKEYVCFEATAVAEKSINLNTTVKQMLDPKIDMKWEKFAKKLSEDSLAHKETVKAYIHIKIDSEIANYKTSLTGPKLMDNKSIKVAKERENKAFKSLDNDEKRFLKFYGNLTGDIKNAIRHPKPVYKKESSEILCDGFEFCEATYELFNVKSDNHIDDTTFMGIMHNIVESTDVKIDENGMDCILMFNQAISNAQNAKTETKFVESVYDIYEAMNQCYLTEAFHNVVADRSMYNKVTNMILSVYDEMTDDITMNESTLDKAGLFYTVMCEAANIDPQMKDIIKTLNEKGYKTKYSNPGHADFRNGSKNDYKRDGIKYGKIYSDAHIMFAKKYDIPSPKHWRTRIIDDCTYFDVVEPTYDKAKGTPSDQWNDWKSKYMASLKTFVDGLPECKDNEKAVKEAVDTKLNNMMNDLFTEFMF